MSKVEDLKRISALRASNLRELLIAMNERGLTKDDVISMFQIDKSNEIVAVYYK